MSARIDELEVLALIEGELDARAAGALRQRLAVDAKATLVLEKLCADRDALRSVPQPALPMDFLAAIEPMLARPMLMEPVDATAPVAPTKPGEYRRQYRKKTRRVRWDRLAIAAVLMFALLGGVWATINGFTRQSRGPDFSVASNNGAAPDQQAPAEILAGAGDSSADLSSLPDGTIHHYRPTPLPADTANGKLVSAPPAGSSEANGPGPAVTAQFALVIHTNDPAVTEQAVQRTASELGDKGALVRNFSFAEAQQLAEEWQLANAGSANAPNAPRVASVATESQWRTPEQLKVLAERVRQRLDLKRAANTSGDAVKEPSGQLAGPKALAPTLEQQLDFSSRGATFTIAVPASQLNTLVERLSVSEGQSTALRMLPERQGIVQPEAPKGTSDSWQPLMLWLTEGPKARQEIERLSQSQPDAIVQVPVIVTHSPKK